MIQEEKRWQEEEAAEAAQVHEEAAEAVECVPVQAEEEVAVVWEDVVRSLEEEDQVADQDQEDQDQEDQDHMEVTIDHRDHQDHQDIITIIITMVEHTTVVEEAADAQAYWRQLF